MVKLTCEQLSEDTWFGQSGEIPWASQEPRKLEPPPSITKMVFFFFFKLSHRLRESKPSLSPAGKRVSHKLCQMLPGSCFSAPPPPPRPSSQCSGMRSFHLEPIIDGECWGCAKQPPQSPPLSSSQAVPFWDGQEQEAGCPVPSSIPGFVKAMHS